MLILLFLQFLFFLDYIYSWIVISVRLIWIIISPFFLVVLGVNVALWFSLKHFFCETRFLKLFPARFKFTNFDYWLILGILVKLLLCLRINTFSWNLNFGQNLNVDLKFLFSCS